MAIRNDVSSLLDRLGRQDLRYREFGDPLGDMEMWPIFEALLQDRRIVGEAPTPLDQRRRNLDAQHRIKAAPPPPPPPLPPVEDAPLPPPPVAQSPAYRPSAPATEDARMRAFFGQLGAGSRNGEHDR